MNTGIIIVSIISLTCIIISIIAVIASSITKANNDSCYKTLLNRIIKTIWRIPSMLWYPIQGSVYALHEITRRLYTTIQDLLKTDEYHAKKTRRLVSLAVGAALNNQSNITNTYRNRHVVKIFTLLLQIISFITTYAGFTFFLGAVNPVAPLFMAITVQGCCYYLLNYFSSQKHSRACIRNILLVSLLLISMTTSYIGIFNGIVMPTETMKSQYNNYSAMVNAIIENQMKTKTSPEIDAVVFSEAVQMIRCVSKNSDSYIDALEEKIKNINTVKRIVIKDVDENNNIIEKIRYVDDPDAAKIKSSLEFVMKSLQKSVSDLSDYVKSSDCNAESVFNAYSNIIANPNKFDGASDDDVAVYNLFSNAVLNCKSILSITEKQSEEPMATSYALENVEECLKLLNIRDNVTNKEAHKLWLSYKLGDYNSDIAKQNDVSADNYSKASTDSSKKILDHVYNFMDDLNSTVVPDDIIRAQEIRNQIESKIDNNYLGLKALVTEGGLEADSNLVAALDDAKAASAIDNVQLMPFTMPFRNRQILGETIFSMIIAISVDGLSWLISFALLNKRPSILYYDQVGKLRLNKEEMLEDCLMYICLKSVVKAQKDCKKLLTKSEINDHIIEKISDVRIR